LNGAPFSQSDKLITPHQATSTNPIIGVRDSGVGGLTVAREIRRALPHSSLLYFADTAHVPYGDRAPDEVRFFALSISEFLIERGAQIVVFACNTTSAYALEEARQRFQVPIIGVIEPGARAAIAVSRNNRIGVLATQATVESGVYTRWITELAPHSRTVEIACPAFVPLVENQRTDSPAARTAAAQYLQPLLMAGVDTIVLGCTHYPLLLPVLQQIAPAVCFVDPAQAVTREVAALAPSLTHDEASKYFERNTFFVSGESGGVRHWIDDLLDIAHPKIEIGPIFERAVGNAATGI